jgi:hypothetical protein
MTLLRMFGVSARIRDPGSSVRIVTLLRVARSGVRISVRELDFCLPRTVQPDLCAPPPKPLFSRYSRSFPKVKRLGREVGQSLLSRAKAKNECSHTSTPRICVHAVDVGLLYLFHHITLWSVI